MEGTVAVKHRRPADAERDPKAAELGRAVSRLRCELAAYPVELSDRTVADEELTALDAMVREGRAEVPELRRSLLLIASSLGSVSRLGPSVTAVRTAIDRFGDAPHR
ncbi:hypothetical protein H8N00_24420 [Streptomyces sp. AC563]|nr:hypothetical protein [Streptomyces buecherae]MBC3991970.1 hypothetical protein [Streptomyces buecherae]QNJ39452.1 hypothetical protein H7H31_05795 [Streptomyces buecherae]